MATLQSQCPKLRAVTARLPHIVLTGILNYVIQRGNRRRRVFFEDADHALYLDMLAHTTAASR